MPEIGDSQNHERYGRKCDENARAKYYRIIDNRVESQLIQFAFYRFASNTRMYSGKSKEALPMCSAFFLIEGSDD